MFLCHLSLAEDPTVIPPFSPLVPLLLSQWWGHEGLSSPLEPVGVTNGNTALPAARSTNSKQRVGGGRERRGVIRKRNEE